jgi:hypothetical protein
LYVVVENIADENGDGLEVYEIDTEDGGGSGWRRRSGTIRERLSKRTELITTLYHEPKHPTAVGQY